MRHGFFAPLGVAALVCLDAPLAWAHIDLLEPEARAHGTAARGDTDIDENSNLKSGPCGQIDTGRSSRVATYAPGQTITVRVREENAHASYLRVSLDLDGEDFPLRSTVPAAPETQEEALAAETALGLEGLLAVVREDNDTAGFVHEIEVTLPDTTCTNCTLQVMQFMYDDPGAPFYFQCADLVLASVDITEGPSTAADAGASEMADVDGGGAPATGGTPSGGSSAVASAATGSGAPAANVGGAGGAAATSAPADGASPNPGAAEAPSADSGSGSNCNLDASAFTPGRFQMLPLVALALMGLGFAQRRRCRSRVRSGRIL